MRPLPIILISIICLILSFPVHAQPVSLEYIFQDTNIINPRPSLKYVNAKSDKIFYYADDSYNGSLSLFDYNYITGETFKYADTGKTPSEFIVMQNGDLLSVIEGDLYISKNFVNTREFTKDIRLTETDEYEYSPFLAGNSVIYRRSGNYFLKTFDSARATSKELQLTKDESDSISYQILSVTDKLPDTGKTFLRIFLARYDNTTKSTYLFPNYTREKVTAEKQKKGISKVNLLEYKIYRYKKASDSLIYGIQEIKYPDTARYSTQYAAYSPDAKSLVLDAETMDRHTRKIYNYDTEKESIKEIYTESDTAWFERHSNATNFISDNDIIFESEISGYNNLYAINRDGGGFRKIAGEDYTILESAVDRKNGKIYFIANKESPVEYFIYVKSLETGTDNTPVKQLTFESGDAENLSISGDGNYLFYEHSYINKPNELYFLNLSDGKETQITNTISPKFSSVDWTLPELVTFNNDEDGQKIYGFVYKPKDFNPKKKYPLICFVHGSGYLQNVTFGFSPYRDNFMVDTYLTSEGYVILDIDFRASLGYGKEFRNKTYHNLGYWEVSDYISGINYLSNLGYIDKDKAGIYGGSYGGFVSLMAAFRHPEVFKAVVALRAVANWKNYFYSNWWYTLARLGDYNNPDTKPYYEQSSPITYAENLQVPLLLTHGMLDDNVFFQDMVQLTQKLIEEKKDFEVMIYPKEYHGFHIQTSWLDQYKRIFKFFEKYLK
jgi:dipeptidyl aminopeptidase/acylaminoacyl peptidase